MRSAELAVPARMSRVAVVAPARRARDALVELARAGVVELAGTLRAMRFAPLPLALAGAVVLAAPAGASAPSVGPLPPAVPRIVHPLWEADVGASVVLVYKAVAAGKATLTYGLIRGETLTAYASTTYRVTVRAG